MHSWCAPAASLCSNSIVPSSTSCTSGGFTVAIETNGTIPVPPGVDWVCVSPKADADLVVTSGDELKLVYPQARVDRSGTPDLAFDHFFLQPMDGPERETNTLAAIDYCVTHPQWRLSVQTHKYLGIP